MEFKHVSVLYQEILDQAPEQTQQILDCTLGGGGHSLSLLEKFDQAHLFAIDRDPDALKAAQLKLEGFSSRTHFQQSRFSEVGSHLEEASIKFDYILADIGVSSHQLNHPERGFSFLNDGPLDMRMTQHSEDKTAKDWIDHSTPEELSSIFQKYGEERFSWKIANAIVNERKNTPFMNTHQLADFVKSVIPKRFHKKGIHPATLVFQALRIAVNDELYELEVLLNTAIDYLAPQGRLAIISFHSLEDRVVKQQFRTWENPCQCPPEFPRCVCGLTALGKRITKRPLMASNEEKSANPRSRSAKLRVFEHC